MAPDGREDEKSGHARRMRDGRGFICVCGLPPRASGWAKGERRESAGGGKATKKDKLKRHRERQDAKIEESVDRVISEFVSQGRIEDRVFDEGVRKLLQGRSGGREHGARGVRCWRGAGLRQPAAYLTKIVCRISAEENPSRSSRQSMQPRSSLQDVGRCKKGAVALRRGRAPVGRGRPQREGAAAPQAREASERSGGRRRDLRGAGVSMCSGTFLDSSADPDGCDARRIRDTVWEAPLGPFRATRAQHEKACKTRGTINRGLLRRIVAANNEMAINRATIKADDRRHGKWRFVQASLAGSHESRVARCSINAKYPMMQNLPCTSKRRRANELLDHARHELEREARSGGPSASLRIIINVSWG